MPFVYCQNISIAFGHCPRVTQTIPFDGRKLNAYFPDNTTVKLENFHKGIPRGKNERK
jgi:hypothetical protein